MIVSSKIECRGPFVERLIYSLIDGKLVVTSDIRDSETNEILDHAVIPIHSDRPLSPEQVCGWINEGVV